MLSQKERYAKFRKMLDKPEKGNNGGNPDAWLWFCGLENSPGDIGAEHNRRLLNDKSYVRMKKQDWSGFNNAVKTILCELKLIGDVGKADEMYQSDCFYCANLFPFARLRKGNKAYADKEIFELTGLPSVDCYERFVTYYRGNSPKWIDFAKNAKIVVCFSTNKKYIHDFLYIFSKSWRELDILEEKWESEDKKQNIITLDGDQTLLIIAHHPVGGKAENLARIVEIISDSKFYSEKS